MNQFLNKQQLKTIHQFRSAIEANSKGDILANDQLALGEDMQDFGAAIMSMGPMFQLEGQYLRTIGESFQSRLLYRTEMARQKAARSILKGMP